MIYGIGEITYEELSPELQKRIDSSSGGVNTVAGLMIVDGIFTKKVTATSPEQKEFEIPFSEYDSLNSHLDIKINSTWINPERYEVVGNKIVLNDGVEIGTNIFFTLFSLAQPTGDGGFIEDVEIAETPQEIIIYDGSIIDEKVKNHNENIEAHADIRELIGGKANTVHKHTVSDIDGLDGIGGSSSWDGITGKPEVFPPSEHTHDVATTSVDGFMSRTDKSKLDGIEVGATRVILNDSVTSTSTTEGATANAVKVAYDKANHSHPYASSTHNHDGTYLSASPTSISFPFTNGSSTLVFDTSTKKFQYNYYSKSSSGLTTRKTYTIPYEDSSSASGGSETKYDLTLLNGWSFNDIIGGTPSKPIIKTGSIVHVQAVISGGMGNGYIGSVPQDCRPSTSRVVFLTYSSYPNNVRTPIIVTTDGNLAIMDTITDTSFVVLDFFYYV